MAEKPAYLSDAEWESMQDEGAINDVDHGDTATGADSVAEVDDSLFDDDDDDEDNEGDTDHDAGNTGNGSNSGLPEKQPPSELPPAQASGSENAPPSPQDAPRYVAQLPDNAYAQLQQISAERAKLMNQLVDGEIDVDAFAEKSNQLDGHRQQLEKAILKAELSAEMAQQREAQEWQRDVNHFLAASKEQGIDYAGNKVLHAALDTQVKELANDPANADKDGRWFLREADKQVRAAFGYVTSNQQQDTQPPASVPAKKSRKPDLSLVPPTLGQVPAAATNATGDDEFTYLDRLSGIEQERALAKLSPEKQAQYLHG